MHVQLRCVNGSHVGDAREHARESGNIGSDEPNTQAGAMSDSGVGGCDGGGSIQVRWTPVRTCVHVS